MPDPGAQAEHPSQAPAPAAAPASPPEGIRLLPFDPLRADADAWRRLQRFRRLRHAESRPEDPPLDDAAFATALRQAAGDPGHAALRYALVDTATGEQVGSLSYGYAVAGLGEAAGDLEEAVGDLREDPVDPVAAGARPVSGEDPARGADRGPGPAQVQLTVLSPWRRRGIGRLAMAEVHRLMTALGHDEVLGSSSEPEGWAFAAAMGAELALVERESRLDLAALDRGRLTRWAAAGAAAHPGARLVLGEGLPAEGLEALAARYAEACAALPPDAPVPARIDAPALRRQAADLAAMGGRWLWARVLDAEGAPLGFSEAIWLAGRPGLVQQGLTGVAAGQRGRGLAKWLKAGLLEHILRTLPQTRAVSTDSAVENEAIQALNTRLGFRPQRETVLARQSREKLGLWLGA